MFLPNLIQAGPTRSGKGISQVPLTMYSSDTEVSDGVLETSGIHKKLGFENYFGSISGQLNKNDAPMT